MTPLDITRTEHMRPILRDSGHPRTAIHSEWDTMQKNPDDGTRPFGDDFMICCVVWNIVAIVRQ